MLFSVFWSRSQAFFAEGPKPNFWVGSGSYFLIKNITVTFEKKTVTKIFNIFMYDRCWGLVSVF